MPIPAPYRLDLGFPNWFLAGTEDDTERAPVPAKVDRLLVPEQVEAIVEVGLPVPRVAFERAAHLRGRIGGDRGALFVDDEPLPHGAILIANPSASRNAFRPRSRPARLKSGAMKAGATRAAWFALVVLLAATGAGVVWRAMRPASEARDPGAAATRRIDVRVDSLAIGRGPSIALSPDGRHLVYVAGASGSVQLYLRDLDRADAAPVAGTDGASDPFFSPDGRWLGFIA